jgi:hypothetical protein
MSFTDAVPEAVVLTNSHHAGRILERLEVAQFDGQVVSLGNRRCLGTIPNQLIETGKNPLVAGAPAKRIAWVASEGSGWESPRWAWRLSATPAIFSIIKSENIVSQ